VLANEYQVGFHPIFSRSVSNPDYSEIPFDSSKACLELLVYCTYLSLKVCLIYFVFPIKLMLLEGKIHVCRPSAPSHPTSGTAETCSVPPGYPKETS
jgi:hypothetical protein